MQAATTGTPVRLTGNAYERGRAQAAQCGDVADLVRERIKVRLDWGAEGLDRPDLESYFAAVHAYTARHYPDILEEIRGIGDGFGLAPDLLFRYLMAQLGRNVTEGAEVIPEDGCSAFAISHPALGAIVGKNRDGFKEILPVQRVFRHEDPAWGGRSFVCVGTLGSPGNYSSGMNSDGLVIADTGHRVNRVAVGMHRYFLLTFVLVNCRSTDEALEAIRGMPHVGGGLLVLGDAQGVVAAVELGPGWQVGIDRQAPGRVGRSNHFVLPETEGFNLDLSRWVHRDSPARFGSLERLLAAPGPIDLDGAAAISTYHQPGGPSLCRHAGPDGSYTLSGSLYLTAKRECLFAAGPPCSGNWERFSLDGAGFRDAGRRPA